MPDDLDTAAARRLARRHAREETLDAEAIYGAMLGHVILTTAPRFPIETVVRFINDAMRAAMADWYANQDPNDHARPRPLQPRALYEATATYLPVDPATGFALCRILFVALTGLASVYRDMISELPVIVEGQLRQLTSLLGISVPAAAPATASPNPSDEPTAAS